MKNRLQWNNVNIGDANAGSQMMGKAIDLRTSATDPLTKALSDYQTTQYDNAVREQQANTGAIIDQIRNGKTPEMSGYYDSNAISKAEYGYKKDLIAEALRRRNEGRANARLSLAKQKFNTAQGRRNRSDADAVALGSFYTDLDGEYGDPAPTAGTTSTPISNNVSAPAGDDTFVNSDGVDLSNNYDYYNDVASGNALDKILADKDIAPIVTSSNDVPVNVPTPGTTAFETVLASRDTPVAGSNASDALLMAQASKIAQANPINREDAYKATASNNNDNSFVPKKKEAKDSVSVEFDKNGDPVITNKQKDMREESVFNPSSKSAGSKGKNKITTSTVNIDGVDYEVREDRRQRIVNQRESKALLKATEKRNYDKMMAFAKKHPRLAKKAKTGFKSWRKEFRANNKADNELTASEKQVIKDSNERERAAFANTMGYDLKTGKPFVKKLSKLEERKALFEQEKIEGAYWSKAGHGKTGRPFKGTPTAYNKPNELVLGTSTPKASKTVTPAPVVEQTTTPAPDKNITFADIVEGIPVVKSDAPAPKNIINAPAPSPVVEEPSIIDKVSDTVSGWFGGDDKTHEQKIEDTLSDMRSQDMKDAGMSKKEIQAEYKRRDVVQKAHEAGDAKKTWKLEDLYAQKNPNRDSINGKSFSYPNFNKDIDEVKPTDQELKSMPRELVMKLRGGYDSKGKPLNNPVFLDRKGNPVIKNGNFVYQGSDGTPTARDKSGYKYSPPLKNGALTAEELSAERKEMLKLFPKEKDAKLLKDGRVLLNDGTIMRPKK